jgi:hypothetical protein
MSQYRIEKIACPSCNKKDTIKIYESVDSTDLSSRKRIMDGSLFTWKCEKCDYMTCTSFNLLYKDDVCQFMVYLAADGNVVGMRNAMDEIEKNANRLSPSQDMRYSVTRRIVLTPNELREKIFIFEAGLDDRVVEIMKCFYISAVIENRNMQIVECLFVIGENDQWLFEFSTPCGQVFSTPIKKDLYGEFKKEYEGYFGEENEYFVNFDYALNLYNKHEEEMADIDEK